MLWRVEQCSSTHGAICWQPRAGARARARDRARARKGLASVDTGLGIRAQALLRL